jgi:YhcH/YjgK/YiaL family protein
MIYDKIENRVRYYGLGENYRIALDFFAEYGARGTEKADIPLSDAVLVKVRPMQTKPVGECRFEAHRRDVDVHFVAGGSEVIIFGDATAMEAGPYDPQKDMLFLEGTGMPLVLKRGDFLIVFPGEAHMPCVCDGEPGSLNKLVAKIPCEG